MLLPRGAVHRIGRVLAHATFEVMRDAERTESYFAMSRSMVRDDVERLERRRERDIEAWSRDAQTRYHLR